MKLANCYQRFITSLAKLAELISQLLGTKSEFVWGAQQEQSSHVLQTALTYATVLALPDCSTGFDLKTDVSNVTVGSKLAQHEQTAAHYSKKLTPEVC